MTTEPPITGSPDLQLGRILIEWGIVTEAAMRECIELQRKLEIERAHYVPRLGELLVERGYATADQILEALAAQNRRIMFCARCGVNVNVDMRPDVMSYRCGKCQGELIEPPAANEIKVVESTIMFVIRDPLPPEVQEAVQNPASKFGKYIIVSEIGRGGIGIVYKAWDTYLGQFVALKRLKPDTGGSKPEAVREGQIQSLLKEARSAVRLRHPHIATVYDIGRVEGEFYISMEYLEGRTLAVDLQEARSKGQVSPYFAAPKRCLRYLRDVARAVHYAHTRPSPVVHCDMKPSNIFVDKSDRAYVLDFGLAKNLRALQDDSPGTISGTPSYMAPEQASGHPEDIDGRTDVYGIGAILYELLTGRPPFIGSLQTVLRKSITELPDRPTEVITARVTQDTTKLLAKISPELEDLCLRCLQKESSLRFQTAHELANSLDRVIKGDTSTVRIGAGEIPTPSPIAIVHPKETPAEPEARPASDTVPSRKPAAFQGPPAPANRRAQILFFIAGMIVTAAIFGLMLLLLKPGARDGGSAPSPPGDPRLASLWLHTANFRPDLGLELCAKEGAVETDPARRTRIAELERELGWIDRVRDRVIQRAVRARFDAFRLRDRELKAVEVLMADKTGLLLYDSTKPVKVSWENVEPGQIVLLAEQSLKVLEPEDLLGMAIYARRAGLRDRAEQMFAMLRTTPLAEEAEKYRP